MKLFYHSSRPTHYPVSLPQRATATTDLNCLTVPLPCEFSGVKGRCLAPFLFLTLCQDSSHGEELRETEAHLVFFCFFLSPRETAEPELITAAGWLFVSVSWPTFLLLPLPVLHIWINSAVVSNKNAVRMKLPVGVCELLIAKGKCAVFEEWPWLTLSGFLLVLRLLKVWVPGCSSVDSVKVAWSIAASKSHHLFLSEILKIDLERLYVIIHN